MARQVGKVAGTVALLLPERVLGHPTVHASVLGHMEWEAGLQSVRQVSELEIRHVAAFHIRYHAVHQNLLPASVLQIQYLVHLQLLCSRSKAVGPDHVVGNHQGKLLPDIDRSSDDGAACVDGACRGALVKDCFALSGLYLPMLVPSIPVCMEFMMTVG